MSNPSPPPSVKAELGSSSPLDLSGEPNSVVKQDQHKQFTIPTILPTETPQEQQQPKQPSFVNYVSDLRNLSPALSAFHRRYDELTEHLHFIKTSIDSKLLVLLDSEGVLTTVDESGKSDKRITDYDHNQSFPLFLSTELVPTVDGLGKPEQTEDNNDTQSSMSEVEAICKKMCIHSLRRYIISNLSNLSKLREEVPLALKLASNPAKLVLKCFGRFFLQGIKAYCKDSPMIPSRHASILVLEYFLLMGFDSGEIEAAVKQEAESSAVDWRKRLIAEGGLFKACEIDARGLLLLIGCFGIPKVFKHEDIKDLIRAGNAKEISDTLQRSNVLLTRIPDVIEWMIQNEMEVHAVDIICIFGMESKFLPSKILSSFLYRSKQTWKETKKESEGSLSTVNKANKRHLSDLKRVRNCLEDRKLDPSKFLPGWKLDDNISKLEIKVSNLDKKIKEQLKAKRKEADESESLYRTKSQDAKRARFSDSRPRVDFIERNVLDGGVPQFSTAYSAYSSVGGLASGIRTADILTQGSYATAVHGGIPADRLGHISNGNIFHPHGYLGEASLNERLVSRSYVEPSAVGANGLYRLAPPAVEGFPGLPNPSSGGVSYRSSASDLYQFADNILERETYGGSRTGASAAIPQPGIASAHTSAYYY